MAMLAHKSSMPMSAGGGSSSGLGAASTSASATTGGGGSSMAAAAREYPGSASASHSRTPLTGSTQNGTFASPTESEFSEAYDGPDPVR